MKSALSGKLDLVALQQAERLYRKVLMSEKDFKDSEVISCALQQTCDVWRNAIAFCEDVDLALRYRRRDFLLQYSPAPGGVKKTKHLLDK